MKINKFSTHIELVMNHSIANVLNHLRGPFNVSLPAQMAGVAALNDRVYLECVRDYNTKWREWR